MTSKRINNPILLISAFILFTSMEMFGQAATGASPVYRFFVENMRVINSRFSDLALVPYSDNHYILMSDRGGKDKYDKWVGGNSYGLYFINRSDWSDFSLPGGLNSQTSNGPVCPIGDGELLVTTTNKRGNIDPKSGLTVYELGISMASELGDKWELEALTPFTSKENSYGHPSVSADGSVMILASNQDGGYGGNDLYISFFEKDKWSTPLNLGPKVNSKGDETFPFLHADGSLYFTSNGHPGYGGTDLFVARPAMRGIYEWTEPLNMGNPVNSDANEYALYFNESMDRGYMSSNRMGGRGGDDIYAIFVDKIFEKPVASAGGAKASTGTESPSRKPKQEKNKEVEETNTIEDIKAVKETTPPVEEMTIKKEAVPPAVEDVDEAVNEPVEQVLDDQKADEVELKPQEKDEVENKAENIGVEDTVEQEAQTSEVSNRKKKKELKAPEAAVEVVEIVVPGEKAGPADESINNSTESAKAAAPVAAELVEVNEDAEPLDGVTIIDVEPAEDYEAEMVEEDLVLADDKIAAVVKKEEAVPEPIANSTLKLLESSMDSENLMNVYFGLNSSKLDANGEALLDNLAVLLMDHPGPVVELHAHADATGDHNINIKLSELRARSIMQYLNRKGIEMDRMRYLAYGESDLYLSQQAEASLNRRVEFRLKDYDHQFLAKDDPARIEGFAYKQLPMLEDKKYFVQMAALSDMRTFSTYKLQEYGAAICFYRGGLYKYVLGPFETLEEATVQLQQVRLNYRDAFIFKNE